MIETVTYIVDSLSLYTHWCIDMYRKTHYWYITHYSGMENLNMDL